MTTPVLLPPPFPVHVITGALGVGKTTAIAHLLANKPEEERWAVILNEFTETGIDALTLAAAARGAYDVRLVPGGCLCCAGELDFTRTLVQLVHEQRPVRLLVEPSGLGHPAAIAEELLQHEARGHLQLGGILCLVDGLRAERLWAEMEAARLAVAEGAAALPERSTERDQFEVADVLVLSKADLATPAQRAAFAALAAASDPPKRWVGEMVDGQLPEAAWTLRDPLRDVPAVALLAAGTASAAQAPSGLPSRWPLSAHRPALHAAEHAAAHTAHAHPPTDGAAMEPLVVLAWPEVTGPVVRRITQRLGRYAVSWTFPAPLVFARLPLLRFMQSGGAGTAQVTVERAKGVFRTGPNDWWNLQQYAGGVGAQPSGWRLDSRLEVLLLPAPVGAADAPVAAQQAMLQVVAAWEAALQQAEACARQAPVNLAGSE